MPSTTKTKYLKLTSIINKMLASDFPYEIIDECISNVFESEEIYKAMLAWSKAKTKAEKKRIVLQLRGILDDQRRTGK